MEIWKYSVSHFNNKLRIKLIISYKADKRVVSSMFLFNKVIKATGCPGSLDYIINLWYINLVNDTLLYDMTWMWI